MAFTINIINISSTSVDSVIASSFVSVLNFWMMWLIASYIYVIWLCYL